MGKKLEITPKIAAALAKNSDGSVDPSTVSVYETRSLNTLPISKKGTIFNGAVNSETLLRQMADYVNNGGFVPHHTLHEQGYELPVGRVFSASVVNNDQGLPELRSLVAIGNNETDLISKIEAGSIDEVSVGVRPQHINCSQCGFDYLGPDASNENFWTQTCNNDHTIGVEGTHVINNGLDRWMEQSFVSLGAANNAKILSRTKSLMASADYDKLRASGITPEATVLFTSPTKKEPKMDTAALLAAHSTALADVTVKTRDLEAATAKVTELKASVDTLTAEITELKAKKDPKADELQVKLTAAEEQVTKTTAYVRSEADRLCVAAGVEKLADTADFATLTASIDANRVKLSSMFGGKAVSQASGAGSDTKDVSVPASSFKTSK